MEAERVRIKGEIDIKEKTAALASDALNDLNYIIAPVVIKKFVCSY